MFKAPAATVRGLQNYIPNNIGIYRPVNIYEIINVLFLTNLSKMKFLFAFDYSINFLAV